MTPDPVAELGDVVDRFDHVSMAVTSFDDARPLIELIGGVFHDGGFEPSGDFHWIQYELPGGARLEMICTESAEPSHFINRFLATKGPGLHHLTFRVHDLARARDAAIERGFAVVGYDDSRPDWKELFVHPGSANGVLVQLAEFPEKGR